MGNNNPTLVQSNLETVCAMLAIDGFSVQDETGNSVESNGITAQMGLAILGGLAAAGIVAGIAVETRKVRALRGQRVVLVLGDDTVVEGDVADTTSWKLGHQLLIGGKEYEWRDTSLVLLPNNSPEMRLERLSPYRLSRRGAEVLGAALLAAEQARTPVPAPVAALAPVAPEKGLIERMKERVAAFAAAAPAAPPPAPAPVIVTAPVAQPAPAPVIVTAPVAQPAPAPVIVTAPVAQPAPAPVIVTAPVAQPAPAPVIVTAPVAQPAPAPVIVTAPVAQPAPAPVIVTAPVAQPAPAPVIVTAPVAVAEQAAEESRLVRVGAEEAFLRACEADMNAAGPDACSLCLALAAVHVAETEEARKEANERRGQWLEECRKGIPQHLHPTFIAMETAAHAARDARNTLAEARRKAS